MENTQKNSHKQCESFFVLEIFFNLNIDSFLLPCFGAMAVAQAIQGLLLKSVDLISQKKLEKDFFLNCYRHLICVFSINLLWII